MLDLDAPDEPASDAGRGRDAGEPERDSGPGPSRDDGGDGCVATREACNGLDDDCDGRVDEVFDLSTDPGHCGGCGNACPFLGGEPKCTDGLCSIECDADRANCDGDPSTGCETSLGSPASCGGCDVTCPSSAPLCARTAGGFTCVVGCEGGLVGCDGACVDLDADPLHCGSCGNACFDDMHGRISCIGGLCTVTDCGDGRDDCNDDPSDGCETLLGTVTDCASCGNACDADETCTGGACLP